MNVLMIFIWVYGAMIAMSFWESSAEGRDAWGGKKEGWKIKLGKYIFLTKYHFFVFWVMFPILITLPLVINGWNTRLFGILVSAYLSGMVVQDFGWYVVNEKVKLKEFWTSFSDYYPWIKIGKKKIIPVGYVLGIGAAVLSWYFLWR